MKMTECFSLPVKCVYDTDGVPFQIDDSCDDLLIDGERTCDETNFEAVAVAINNHDRLVDEVAELRKVIKSAMQVKDLWLPSGAFSDEPPNNYPEVEALHLMYRDFELILNKTENTSND